MGRVSVDVYPLQVGVHLEDVETFGKYLGGSPTNVAVAAARHGRRTDLAAIRAARVFWATVTGLCEEPSRTATLAALAARSQQRDTVLDLDYRPMFWSSPEEASGWVGQALEHVTVAVGNVEECEVAVGEHEPYAAAEALLDRGVRLAIVKRGPKGVLAASRADSGGTDVVEVPPVEVEVVNGLGAGDAFGGALCHGLLAGWDVERTVRFANAAGAIVASRLACSPAMPTTPEVDQLVAGGPLPSGPEPGGPVRRAPEIDPRSPLGTTTERET
ncbi:PfkB family carbohydrate kinase [Actinoallomurus acanthiterrae]